GHADADEHVAADRGRQPTSLLLLRPPGEDVRQADGRVHGGHDAVRAPPGELLHDDRVVEEVAATAAVRLRQRGAEEPLLAEPSPRLAVGDAAPVPAGDLRLDLALREAPELIAEHLVLLGEDVASHGANIAGARGPRPAAAAHMRLSWPSGMRVTL